MDNVKVQMNPPASQQQPTSIEADIPALIIGGVLEREVTSEFLPGYKIRMHTLTDPERVQSLKEVPNDLLGHMVAAQEASKLPTLVQAITYIEKDGAGRHFDKPEDKIALRSMLQGATSAIVIDVLHTEYQKLVNDLLILIETGVKKN